ncbi:TPM domain-containing protein [Pararhodonellum marinum]|uniref:TPM domain-containing protein n=1 Tax=Pararhodonellum marinum TaxID=2755358 RepID=UPI00188EBA40|nr:TPM domain-containing protein [Pararhodonellum marinum]
MKKKILYLFLFVALFTFSCGQKKGQSIYFVNDWAHILTDEEISSLTDQIRELEQSIGSQIVILTIESLDGESIEDYSLRKASNWGIGRKDYDDGILITVALQDRQMRIEVSDGLGKIIKDEIAYRIIIEDMAPKFQTGEYYEGLFITVEKIKKLIKENKELVGQHL